MTAPIKPAWASCVRCATALATAHRYIRTGHVDAALHALLRTACTESPDDWQARVNLALAHQQRGYSGSALGILLVARAHSARPAPLPPAWLVVRRGTKLRRAR